MQLLSLSVAHAWGPRLHVMSFCSTRGRKGTGHHTVHYNQCCCGSAAASLAAQQALLQPCDLSN